MQKKEKDAQKNKLIIILSIVIVVILVVGIWFLFFKQPRKINPDYALQEKESNAQEIGDDSEKMESPDGGGAASLLYSKNVKVDLSDSKALLMIGNPKKSTQDIVFQIVIDGAIIAQSGRVSPGYKVEQLSLDKNVKNLLTKGGYKGKFKIYYYDETSGEKAMLNTEIPVSIEVND